MTAAICAIAFIGVFAGAIAQFLRRLLVSDAVSDSAAPDEIPEEIVAAIVAAVAVTVATPHRVVRIRGLTPEQLGWLWGGRIQHHTSHRPHH